MTIAALIETAQARLLEHQRRWVAEPSDDVELRALKSIRAQVELLNLISIEQQVKGSYPQLLVGSAFGCFGQLIELPLDGLLTVLSHPVSVRWSADARALLSRQEAGPLREHLDNFAPLAISCFVTCGEDFALDEACLQREFSFPGLGLAIRQDKAQSLGLATVSRPDGAIIELRRGDRVMTIAPEAASVDLDCSDAEGLEVFRLPRCYGRGIFFEYAEPMLRRIFSRGIDDGEVDVTLWLSRLEESAQLLRRCWPEMYDELTASVRAIVPASAGSSEHQSTGSDSTASGAISTTLVTEPWFTDGIIHEHRHDLLNNLSLLDDILADDAPGATELYSPWRPEPRPPVGLLHAVFVFVAVAEFYKRLLTVDGEALNVTHEEIAEALGLQVINLFNGLEELKAGASFSTFGRELWSSLMDETLRLHREAVRLGVFTSGGVQRKASTHYQTWKQTWGRQAISPVQQNIQRWARL